MTWLQIPTEGWPLVGYDDDPVRGDPEAIEAMAQRLMSRGENFDRTAQDLRAADPSDFWQSSAGLACADNASREADKLGQLASASEKCAQALRTWAEQLRRAQEECRLTLEDARDAKRRLDEAEAHLQDLVGGGGIPMPEPLAGGDFHTQPATPTAQIDVGPAPMPAPASGTIDTNEAVLPPDESERIRWRQQAEEARQDLATARHRVESAVVARDDAASLAAQSIGEAVPTPLFYTMAS